MSDKQKGEKSHWFGKQHSEETKKLMSEKQQGENSPNSILTEKKVIKIIKLSNEGNLTQLQISDLFGISRSTVSMIKTRKIWSHIKIGDLKH